MRNVFSPIFSTSAFYVKLYSSKYESLHVQQDFSKLHCCAIRVIEQHHMQIEDYYFMSMYTRYKRNDDPQQHKNMVTNDLAFFCSS